MPVRYLDEESKTSSSIVYLEPSPADQLEQRVKDDAEAKRQAKLQQQQALQQVLQQYQNPLSWSSHRIKQNLKTSPPRTPEEQGSAQALLKQAEERENRAA